MKKDNVRAQADKPSRISFFAMIADPIRHTIVTELLSKSELSVNQLVGTLKKPQTLVSYHLRCLRECGLLTSQKSPNDGRKIIYSLHDRDLILNLFTLADDFLKDHEICLGHPSCRIKEKNSK
ncbi:MAG: ArsR/SmtB family transcription factor [Candidatus Heimdallarchaeota archaeon]